MTDLTQLSDEELIALYKSTEKQVVGKGTLQLALKVLANALYGASANEYFLFYDTRIAEGITHTGQFVIQNISRDIDINLNKLMGTENEVFVFMNDTDSAGVTLGPIIEKYFKNHQDKLECVRAVSEGKLAEIIDKTCQNIHENYNWLSHTLYMKTEAFADRGFMTGKKRYAFNVLENEGVKYAKPKLKITGLDTVRSSTPPVVRENLETCIRIILQEDEDTLKKFFNKFKTEYFTKTFPIEKMAYPRGVNDLKKYSPDSISLQGSSIPIACRASVNHNKMVEKLKLKDKYPFIKNGDKIRYIYLNKQNPIKDDVIGWVGSAPKEFNLDRFIDYKTMFEKSFISPLKKITDAIEWKYEDKVELEDELFE